MRCPLAIPFGPPVQFPLLAAALAGLFAGCDDNYYYDSAPGTGTDPGAIADPDADYDQDSLTNEQELVGWTIWIDELGFGPGASTELMTSRHCTSETGNADTDGDGLDDGLEFLLRTDPRSRDTDADGLEDFAEFYQWHSSPSSIDSDGDCRGPFGDKAPMAALFDGNELEDFISTQTGSFSLPITSPTLADTDGDGRTDFEELDDPARHPLIAELPRPSIEIVG